MQFLRGHMYTIIILAVLLIAAGGLAYYLTQRGAVMNDPLSLRSLEDQVALTDFEGNPVSLKEYRGSVLIVNLWASWTPFSITELPLLATLVAEYNNEEVRFIAVNRAEPVLQAQAFLNTISGVDALTLLLDPGDTLYKSLGGFAMPETVVYDARGVVVAHLRGPVTADQLKAEIARALDGS